MTQDAFGKVHVPLGADGEGLYSIATRGCFTVIENATQLVMRALEEVRPRCALAVCRGPLMPTQHRRRAWPREMSRRFGASANHHVILHPALTARARRASAGRAAAPEVAAKPIALPPRLPADPARRRRSLHDRGFRHCRRRHLAAPDAPRGGGGAGQGGSQQGDLHLLRGPAERRFQEPVLPHPGEAFIVLSARGAGRRDGWRQCTSACFGASMAIAKPSLFPPPQGIRPVEGVKGGVDPLTKHPGVFVVAR